MLPVQAQLAQLGANNQANPALNLIKFDKYNSFDNYYTSYRNEKEPITLLNHPLEIFKYIPKNFAITTEKGSYNFNDAMLKDTSSVISKFITENPNVTEYHINIKDDDNVMSKIENMYNGKKITFENNELNVLRQITSALNIVCCPKFMKFESFKSQEYYHNKYKNHSVKINIAHLRIFLDQTYPKSFTISTNNNEYKCNKLGIKSSSIINELFEKNPNLESFHFDFDDEFNIFQEICNFFNFMPIEITTDNMHVLKKMVDDLQINFIIKSITDIIESYESAVQKIDEKHILIDSIVDLCNVLYDIKNLGVENVHEKIIKSVWSTTEENVQELACYLIQAVHNDFSLHSYIFDLIMSLDKSSSELNELKNLLPYFIKQIMFAFPKNKLNCAFVFRLVQNRLVSIDDVVNILETQAKIFKSKKGKGLFRISRTNDENEKERFISNITNTFDINVDINPLNLKNAILWFFPEITKNADIELIIKDNSFIKKYSPNEIDSFKKMRESYEPDDEISKAINIDDVDTLQKILSQYQPKTNLISYNLFDSITETKNNTFINYAASKGSIKCFKYLLLNHYELDESSLYYAVLGKNIEIIRIVDQYSNDNNKIFINYKFNSNDFIYNKRYFEYDDDSINKDPKSHINTPIIPAILMHQNDIFDWILEQKYINNGITGNLLFDVAVVAIQNGNAHAFIQCVDKGFDINSIPTRNINIIIRESEINGFYKLTQLIISFLSSNILRNDLKFLIDFEDSIFCGNLSIAKLFFSIQENNVDISKGLNIAAKKGYLHIIKELFETDFAEKIEIKQTTAISAFAVSVQNHQTEIFDYLFNSTVLPHSLSENSLFSLLSYFSYLGDLKATQTFTEFILKKKNIVKDFTVCFLYAACLKHEKICKYLIDRKVLINYADLVSKSLILTCCNKEIFVMLFDSVDPEVKETFIGQLLYDSIKNQNNDLIEFLLEKGSPYDDSLYEAVLSKNIDIVNIILKHNSKPSFINRLYNSGTALNKAVDLGEFEIVKRLLSIKGIDPSLYANNNITPLVSAITSFRLDLINLILDFYGDDIESQTWQLDEALKKILTILSEKKSYYPQVNHVKVKEGEEEEEEEAEEERKKEILIPNQNNKYNNKNKLILTVLNRLIQIKNIDLNCRENKYTLLSFACETNEIDMVSMLIKSDKVNVNSYAPKNGSTPLMIAIENKNIKIAELLIKFPKTNINIRNYNRKTALIYAVEQNLPKIVDLIINNERFDSEESLLDYAFFISAGQISKQLFLLNELNVNYKYFEDDMKNDDFDNEYHLNAFSYYNRNKMKKNNKSFETTLIHAVKKEDKEKIELIIKHQSFDPIKSQIKAALFASVNSNDICIFKSLLLKNNNDVNICSQSHESLLSFSISNNRDEIVEEIINNKNFDLNKVDILSIFLQTYQSNEKNQQQQNDDVDDEFNQNVYGMQKLKHSSLKSMNLIYKFDENHNHSIDFTQLLPNGKSFFTIMNPKLNNNRDAASFLLNHGVDPDKPDNFGEYPLKYCIENDLYGAASVLIKTKKVDLSRRFTLNEKKFIISDSKNATYLHLAACKKSSKILSELIDTNIIDINCKDDSDETPLIKAIKHKSLENISLLFSKDNLEYKNNSNDNDDNDDYDIIEVAKTVADYRKNDEVHLESKKDYLDYLIHIITSSRY